MQPKSAAPSTAEFNQLVALYNAGHYAELESQSRSLVEKFPAAAFAWKLLGGALLMQGKDALPAFQKTAELMPGDAEAHYNLGVALRRLGRLDEAAASYRSALKIKPNYAEALGNLGNVQKDLGQLDEAVDSYRRALQINPGFAETHCCLGNALSDLGRFDEAVASYQHALKIKSDLNEARHNMGIALYNLGQFSEAADCYRRALELEPYLAAAHSNLGNVLKSLGQFDEAAASCRRALEIDPEQFEAYDNLLLSLNYIPSTSPSSHLAEARQYGRMVAGKVTSRFTSWQCEANPKRLRVGMVSGDLRTHPVGYFLESLLTQIDPARVELIAYPTQRGEDALTARIKPHFSAWHSLVGLDDQAAAQLIHADGVHVLIDLAGHTADNRLPVFAWKPAPVQAAWLGYFATTGVLEMDYLIADQVGVPVAHQKNFTETVWYLPDTRLCFSPPEIDLPVAPLPAKNNGHITFGCFQNLAKVGNEVLEVWANILTALPSARLRWQCKQLGDPVVAEKMVQRLQQHGMDPARIALHGAVSREAYLAAHAEVDLLLDTFPYPGGTTTCESLWMGVPTLTVAGDTLLARQGASLLTAAGLEDWIAASVKDYVDRAIALSSDLTKLATLRAGLREQVKISPLFNAPRFARNLEDALWAMWQAKTQRT